MEECALRKKRDKIKDMLELNCDSQGSYSLRTPLLLPAGRYGNGVISVWPLYLDFSKSEIRLLPKQDDFSKYRKRYLFPFLPYPSFKPRRQEGVPLCLGGTRRINRINSERDWGRPGGGPIRKCSRGRRCQYQFMQNWSSSLSIINHEIKIVLLRISFSLSFPASLSKNHLQKMFSRDPRRFPASVA